MESSSANKASNKKLGTVVAFALVLATLVGSALYFGRDESVAKLSQSDTECRTSSVTLYTSKARYADTETGLFFCNRGSGCTRLDTPDHDDFEKGKTKSYSMNTFGGESDHFCICGSRDAWTGQVKAVNMCGKDYTVDADFMRLTMNENVASGYQCAYYQTGVINPIKQWKPVSWHQCGFNVFVLSLSYLGSTDFKDDALTFKSNGKSAPINRWNSNDFKPGTSDVFYVSLGATLGDDFTICTDRRSGGVKFVGKINRLEAPLENGERVILSPANTDSFDIYWKDLPPGVLNARYEDRFRCAWFRVDLDKQIFTYFVPALGTRSNPFKHLLPSV